MSFHKSFKPVVVFNIKTLKIWHFQDMNCHFWTSVFVFKINPSLPFSYNSFAFFVLRLECNLQKKKSFLCFSTKLNDARSLWHVRKKIAEKNQFRSLQQTFVLISQKNKTIMFKSVPKSESCPNEVWKYTE